MSISFASKGHPTSLDVAVNSFIAWGPIFQKLHIQVVGTPGCGPSELCHCGSGRSCACLTWWPAPMDIPHRAALQKGRVTQENRQQNKPTVYNLCVFVVFFFNCLWIPSCCLEMHHVRSRPTYKNSLCSAEVEPGKGLLQRNNAPLPPLTANGKYKWSLRNNISSL